MTLTELAALAILAVVTAMFLGPIVVGGWLYLRDRRQGQHAVLRNFPLLGRLRYVFEHVGPELRQYLFNADRGGEPFSRDEYQAIVFGGKYLNALISFGSHRDFEQPGWYLRNAMLPTLAEEMQVDREPRIATSRYVVDDEGLFARHEHREPRRVAPWTLTDEAALTIGTDLPHPWTLRGLVGMSAMSYGALGRHAIRAMSEGIGLATGSWMNTGEGGLSEHHLVGADRVVFQIGPGLFGVRTEAGAWDWPLFREQAALPQVCGFELKFHQGAKIRGGHVEGRKVTPEIARIRRVTPWKTIDSPNRFPMFRHLEDALDWVARMREEGGKPVGVKVVIGGPGSADELAEAIARHGATPDWITVDGGEGGSGATYLEMADSMGLPVQSAIVELDDALRRAGVREQLRVFASGKLATPDKVALALCLGADAVNVGRGLMISVGCIQAQKCHTNRCPVGVATTDERLMRALVIDEKKWRVANYLITLRAGLATLAAASGLRAPTGFERRHAVFRDERGRSWSAEELFPVPSPGEPRRPRPLEVAATLR